jgi:hypothetical protein
MTSQPNKEQHNKPQQSQHQEQKAAPAKIQSGKPDPSGSSPKDSGKPQR